MQHAAIRVGRPRRARGSHRSAATCRSCSTSRSRTRPWHAAIREAGGDLVGPRAPFDLHEGTPLPAGKKSLAFSIEFRDPSRTLEREEADEAIERIRVRVWKSWAASSADSEQQEARERPPV